MIFEISGSIIIILTIVYYCYIFFIGPLLNFLDFKLENLISNKSIFIGKIKIKYLTLYDITKLVLLCFSILFFLDCSLLLFRFIRKIPSTHFLEAFFILIVPYLGILFILVINCLRAFKNKKIPLSLIILFVLFSYACSFLSIASMEVPNLPLRGLPKLQPNQPKEIFVGPKQPPSNEDF